MKSKFLFMFLSVAACGLCHAQEAADVPPPKPDITRLAERLLRSHIRVEYELKYDGDDAPELSGRGERCPNCGGYHSRGMSGGEKILYDKRPLKTSGWVVAPDTVLIDDPGVPSRFIDSVKIVLPGGGFAVAREHAVFTDTMALLLKTETALEGAIPLAFAEADPPPRKGLLAAFDESDAERVLKVSKTELDDMLPVLNARRGIRTVMDSSGLFLSENGEPLGFLMSGDWDPEKPLALPPFDARGLVMSDTLKKSEQKIADIFGDGIYSATLNFRSPREDEDEDEARKMWWSDEEFSTVQYAVAVHIAPRRLVVLKQMKPHQTARLESVTVRDKNGADIPVRFVATLKTFGAFVVESDALESAPVTVRGGDMRDLENTPLLYAAIFENGDQLTMKTGRIRFFGFEESYKGHIVAEIWKDAEMSFVFTPQGELVNVPIKCRPIEWNSPHHAATLIAALVAELSEDETDAMNVPLAENDENRVAWLGAELQRITSELAEMMGIAHLNKTDYDGINSGGIITFIHPNSPAAKAGLKEGDVVLRIKTDDRMAPYLINDDGGGYGGIRYFSFENDFEEYDDDMGGPTPWSSVYNKYNKTLTEIGFGKNIRLACVIDGEQKEIPMTIERSPDTYENAPRYESKTLGFNVRDLTYEVRNFFKLAEDFSGVVISRVENGKPAAIAGLRVGEIIRKVNDTPVSDVKEFETLTKDKTEFQLTVRRLNRDHIVPMRNANQ